MVSVIQAQTDGMLRTLIFRFVLQGVTRCLTARISFAPLKKNSLRKSIWKTLREFGKGRRGETRVQGSKVFPLGLSSIKKFAVSKKGFGGRMQEFCEGRGRKTRVQDPRVVPLGFKPSAFATDASVDGKYSTPS